MVCPVVKEIYFFLTSVFFSLTYFCLLCIFCRTYLFAVFCRLFFYEMGVYMFGTDIAIALSMVVPAALCVIASYFFSMKYSNSDHVGVTVAALTSAADKLVALPPSDMANLPHAEKIIDSEFSKIPASGLAVCWTWYAADTGALYDGKAAPTPKPYFPYDILTENLRVKSEYMRSSYLVVFFSVLSFLICTAVPVLFDKLNFLAQGLVIGAISLLVSLLACVTVSLSYRARLRTLKLSLSNFHSALSSRLISAEAPTNTALILRSNNEAIESFGKSVDMLTKKIESFVSAQITPAVADAFDKSIAAHVGPALDNLNNGATESIGKLADEYERILEVNNRISTYLGESIESASEITRNAEVLAAAARETTVSVKEIAERNDELSKDVAGRLAVLSESLDAFVEKMNEGLESNAQTAEKLSDAMLKIASISDEHIDESAKTAAAIIETMTKTTSDAIEEHFTKYALSMTKDVQFILDNNSKTCEALAQSVIKIDEAGSAQFEKASEVAASMITDISKEMRHAMKNIGTDVADTIQQAYKENEKYINTLTERTEKLVREYDAYFEGLDKNTNDIMTNMDMIVTSSLTRMADEFSIIIDSFNKTVSESAERYEVNSRELVLSFTEQTRDMGLYAHEINIDITSLSENLKDSVSIFNKNIQQGINQTFTEFDRGLAEFTRRMTNTVEAIRESVDRLPMALADLKK